MKYLGYVILLVACVAGYIRFFPAVILALALLSTLVFANVRRKTLKETPMAPDQNMLIDGAFLFFQQLLIVFVVYLIGYFASTDAADLFLKFLTGQRD